ncbi:MAG: hypothetical protein IJS69_04960 [Selenomonadaceae bacterium]|nr:hypothetical protein [Selenomonadaceae bacterium]
MNGKFSTLTRMFSFGFESFSLFNKRPRRRFVCKRKFLTAAQRWQLLGERLQKSVEKVVGKTYEAEKK